MREPHEDRDPAMWRPPEGLFPANAWFGMTLRRGGGSSGPYASLNLGLEVGDDRGSVLRNRALVLTALGIDGAGPARLHQVHGSRIVKPFEAPCRADGFFLEPEDPWAAVSAADCAPVAIVARTGAFGALLHSGWRGARDRIAALAARLLVERGVEATDLRAAIGPCIHACCYPVGPEVAGDFPREVLRPHPAGVALDLPLAIARALTEAGLPGDAIHAAPECTSCRADDFYSHRRDRGVTGRHWALLRLERSGAPDARRAGDGGSSAPP
ncbi:MAG: laccase domain-containing protein [Candidatus Latescibacteria bacterium]|nr:laccase domain-containing protein [Candidatus Latescibacterota bacterium]